MSEASEEKSVNSTLEARKKQTPGRRKRKKYLVTASLVFLCLIFLVLSFYFLKTNTLITLTYAFRHLYILTCLALLFFLLYSTEKETGGLKWSQAVPIFVYFLILILPVLIISLTEKANVDVIISTCSGNMKKLHSRFVEFSNQNNHRYPDPNKWCDLIGLKENKLEFVCPLHFSLIKSFNYADNPNCEPNSPGDVVLLFESNSGWNQSGGPEILNASTHSGWHWFFGYRYYGCNILFNDGHVEFVNSKNLKNLKWK